MRALCERRLADPDATERRECAEIEYSSCPCPEGVGVEIAGAEQTGEKRDQRYERAATTGRRPGEPAARFPPIPGVCEDDCPGEERREGEKEPAEAIEPGPRRGLVE